MNLSLDCLELGVRPLLNLPCIFVADSPFVDWFGGAVMETSGYAVDCLLPADWPTPRPVMHQIVVICLPLLVFLLISLTWLRNYRSTQRGRKYLAKRSLLTLIVVFYVSYISITKAGINVFYCVHVHDVTTLEGAEETHYLWALDTAVTCYENSHLNLVLFVGIPVLFFSLLFPISLASGLIFARGRRTLECVWVQETVGLFFRGFEQRFIFWDSIIMLRKALLAAIVVFAYSLGGNLQGLLAVGLLVLSLFLQMGFSPFKSTYGYLNQLESMSLLVSILTFLTGVTLNDPEMHSGAAEFVLVALVLICNIGLAVLLLYLVTRAKIDQIRFGLLAEGIDCAEESGIWVMQAYILSQLERFREMATSALWSESPVNAQSSLVESYLNRAMQMAGQP